MIELDPKYDSPKTAKWLRLMVSHAQGAQDRSGTLGAPAPSAPAIPPPSPPVASGRAAFAANLDWAAALELTIATHGAEPYKSRLRQLFPQMIKPQQMGFRCWTAVRALPYLDRRAKDQMREAVKTYMASQDKQLNATPFGVPPAWAPGAVQAPWLTWPFGCTFFIGHFQKL